MLLVFYHSHLQKQSWTAAAACAVERGGYLIKIDNINEQNAIYDTLINAKAALVGIAWKKVRIETIDSSHSQKKFMWKIFLPVYI